MVCVCNMVGGGSYDDVYAVDDAEDDDVYAVDDEVTLVHGQACVTETPTTMLGIRQKNRFGLFDYVCICCFSMWIMMVMLKMMKNVLPRMMNLCETSMFVMGVIDDRDGLT
jgi:hypothetical protein